MEESKSKGKGGERPVDENSCFQKRNLTVTKSLLAEVLLGEENYLHVDAHIHRDLHQACHLAEINLNKDITNSAVSL